MTLWFENTMAESEDVCVDEADYGGEAGYAIEMNFDLDYVRDNGDYIEKLTLLLDMTREPGRRDADKAVWFAKEDFDIKRTTNESETVAMRDEGILTGHGKEHEGDLRLEFQVAFEDNSRVMVDASLKGVPNPPFEPSESVLGSCTDPQTNVCGELVSGDADAFRASCGGGYSSGPCASKGVYQCVNGTGTLSSGGRATLNYYWPANFCDAYPGQDNKKTCEVTLGGSGSGTPCTPP